MVDTPAKSANELTVGMLAQRLDGNDEAIRLLQAKADKQPDAIYVQLETHALKELTEANFKALRELVDSKFEGNKVALDAALKTQKEGSDKIESNFVKQIDGVLGTISTLTKTTDDKIGDLKDRFNTREGQGAGLNRGWGYVVGAGGLVAAIVAIVAFFATKT